MEPALAALHEQLARGTSCSEPAVAVSDGSWGVGERERLDGSIAVGHATALTSACRTPVSARTTDAPSS